MVELPSDMHVVEAQAVHDWEMREQTSLLEHEGHDGVVSGHSTHRLNRVARVLSTAREQSVDLRRMAIMAMGGCEVGRVIILLTETAAMAGESRQEGGRG